MNHSATVDHFPTSKHLLIINMCNSNICGSNTLSNTGDDRDGFRTSKSVGECADQSFTLTENHNPNSPGISTITTLSVDEGVSIYPDGRKSNEDSFYVDWAGPSDPTKPMNWSNIKKWTIVITTTMVSFMVSFGSSVFSATISQTTAEFGVSREVMLLGVTLYVLGFAFGPLIWGPASELYGRTLPLWAGLFLFCIFQVPLAVAGNLHTVLIVRFFAGLFGSAPLAIVAGMYVDFLDPVGRGISVSIFSLGAFCGPIAGPVIGNLITESLDWRWVGWVTLFGAVVFGSICFLTTPESSEPVLLRRRAHRLRLQTKNFALHAKCEEDPAHMAAFIQKYLTKPLRMIVVEPIVSLSFSGVAIIIELTLAADHLHNLHELCLWNLVSHPYSLSDLLYCHPWLVLR